MNHASGKASNAVLAKARALYGRRLRAEDYNTFYNRLSAIAIIFHN